MYDTPIHIHSLSGLQEYEPTWHAMQDYTERRDINSADEIWLLQHPPVYTLGRNGKAEHLLDPGTIPVINIDRGGQVTYHGPGQLVAYLLLDIKRRKMGVRGIVSAMENALIALLADYDIKAQARSDAPGVYVAGAKIAALGLRIKQGRCYHGLSLNLDMDLTPFSHINPCGYEGMAVSQLSDLTTQWQWPELEQQLSQHLCQQLGNADCIQLDAIPGALSHE